MAYCGWCGVPVEPGSKFCSQCGGWVFNPADMAHPPHLVKMGGRLFYEPSEHRVFSPYYYEEFVNRKPPKIAPPRFMQHRKKH